MMRATALFLALLLFSTGAWAENGLQRFERELRPQIEPHTFSYGRAEALGDSGFILEDVVATAPAMPETDNRPTTIRIDKAIVEAIDFERLADPRKEQLPRFAKFRLEGVTGDRATVAMLATYGVPNVPADIALDYKLDPGTRRLTVETFEISLRRQGRVALSLVSDGVSDRLDDAGDARDSGRLQRASLTIDDSGLIAKLLIANAASQGAKPEDLVSLVLLTLASFAGPQDPESMKAFDAVASFVSDWRAPKGPITFTVTPAPGTSFADVGNLLMPNALREVLGLEVTYAGTRAGAAISK